MTRSHRIRLHAAWKRLEGAPAIALSKFAAGPEPLAEQALEFANRALVSLPDAALHGCISPWVIYCRQFNRPTGIGPENKIWIDCGLLDYATCVMFNGQELSAPSPGQRLEITGLLRPHNELRVVIPAESFASASLVTVAELAIETEDVDKA